MLLPATAWDFAFIGDLFGVEEGVPLNAGLMARLETSRGRTRSIKARLGLAGGQRGLCLGARWLGLLVVGLAGLAASQEQEELPDTYWSGTAPLCLGGCKGKHKELKRSLCGNGSCCWLGYKSFCRVNCGRPEADFNSVVYGNDWWVGSVVRYACRPGFLLLGDPASACQADGRWTPKPSCLPPQ
ncbi:CUB and sushi domain-containing protein 3-like [Alligator sinensis]|uniref:CUB and sushi domain-containing protein 3-like n=1 Tax=Alligator sinensis TaxID=38654 RepID=A0A3Q0GZ19_ALLSI|nr:CUB and sushi domain-containing protein 3-like [Alligator sinensis]